MKKIFYYIVIVFCAAVFVPMPVVASQPSEHIAVILVIDNSGSMKTSDPENLRFTGVNLFASLLDPGDSLGIILFSTDSKTLTNGAITISSKPETSRLLAELTMPPADGYTDIKAALEDAGRLIETVPQPGMKTAIVLLTDGKPEIQNPYSTYEQEILDVARSLNTPIMTIALTSAAQAPFLDSLTVITKGRVIPADHAADLVGAYLQVLAQVKDRTVIGGDKFDSQTILNIQPMLAPYVLSATFIVTKPEIATVRVFDSGGYELTGEPAADARFSLFSLQDFAGGEYTFRLQGGGEAQVWAILHSRLRLRIVKPRNFHPLGSDMPIIVNMFEETIEGNSITINGKATFTALITSPDGHQTSLDQFYDDGTHGDAVADDGKYTRFYPDPHLAGVYQILIQGWKGPIPVQLETQVKVLKFPGLLVNMPQEKIEVRGEAIRLRVDLDDQPYFDEGEIVAQIISPSGVMDEISLQPKDAGYEGLFLPTENGTYHVIFATSEVTHLGVEYQTQVEKTFTVELIPTAIVEVEQARVISTCFPYTDEYSLWLSVTASEKDVIRFSVPGWRVMPEEANLHKGEQKHFLQLRPLNQAVEEVEHVDLQVGGSRRLEIQPTPTIQAVFHTPGFYARCRAPINIGTVILLVSVISVTSINRIRKAAQPPLVTGTLRHWEMGGNPAQADEIDLTSLQKPALLIGCGVTCDVMIPQAELAPEHARVLAERSSDHIAMYLEPIGEVHEGYSPQSIRFVLRHGGTFRMGVHEFQYLSDHGE